MLSQISVVVCTRNRYAHLERCLKSMVKADWPCRELIVIDGSDDKSTIELNKKATKSVGGTYFYEEKKGLSAARNRGIKESNGDIVMFADDDFIVKKGWIANLIRHYSDANVVCCTGRMLPYRTDELSDLFEQSLSFDKGDRVRLFSKDDIGVNQLFNAARVFGRRKLGGDAPVPWAVGNGYFSLRKKALKYAGYFYEDLGIGTPALGGEEIEMFYRLLKSGLKAVYDPTGVILHNHRQSYNDFFKAAYNAGASERAFIRKYYSRDAYAASLFIGILGLRILTLLKVSTRPKRDVTYAEYMKLKGFFHKQ
jgi:glycosyltransferase involved in cell wall biosynthesis